MILHNFIYKNGVSLSSHTFEYLLQFFLYKTGSSIYLKIDEPKKLTKQEEVDIKSLKVLASMDIKEDNVTLEREYMKKLIKVSRTIYFIPKDRQIVLKDFSLLTEAQYIMIHRRIETEVFLKKYDIDFIFKHTRLFLKSFNNILDKYSDRKIGSSKKSKDFDKKESIILRNYLPFIKSYKAEEVKSLDLYKKYSNIIMEKSLLLKKLDIPKLNKYDTKYFDEADHRKKLIKNDYTWIEKYGKTDIDRILNIDYSKLLGKYIPLGNDDFIIKESNLILKRYNDYLIDKSSINFVNKDLNNPDSIIKRNEFHFLDKTVAKPFVSLLSTKFLKKDFRGGFDKYSDNYILKRQNKEVIKTYNKFFNKYKLSFVYNKVNYYELKKYEPQRIFNFNNNLFLKKFVSKPFEREISSKLLEKRYKESDFSYNTNKLLKKEISDHIFKQDIIKPLDKLRPKNIYIVKSEFDLIKKDVPESFVKINQLIFLKKFDRILFKTETFLHLKKQYKPSGKINNTIMLTKYANEGLMKLVNNEKMLEKLVARTCYKTSISKLLSKGVSTVLEKDDNVYLLSKGISDVLDKEDGNILLSKSSYSNSIIKENKTNKYMYSIKISEYREYGSKLIKKLPKPTDIFEFRTKLLSTIEKTYHLNKISNNNNKSLQVHERWWFLKPTKTKIKLQIPRIDYDYGSNPILGVTQDPVPEFAGYAESNSIEVSIEILIDIINIIMHWWNQSATMLQFADGEEATQGLSRVLYNWYSLETSIGKLKRLGVEMEYLRCFRLIRWHLEKEYMACIQDKQNNKLYNGNYYISHLLEDLVLYMEEHYYDIVPLYNNISRMSEGRTFVGNDVNDDIITKEKEFDKTDTLKNYIL